MTKKESILFSALLFLAGGLSAQLGKETEASVRQMFDEPVTVAWVKTWQGYWDLYHEIEFQLGYNGNEIKGKYLFPGQDLSFELTGHQQKGEWLIQELDAEGRISGYFLLEEKEGNLHGAWWSVDFIRSVPIDLKPKGLIQLQPFKPELLLLGTASDESHSTLMLMKESPGQVSGYLYERNEESSNAIFGECKSYLCNEILLTPEKDPSREMRLFKSGRGDYTLRVDGSEELRTDLILRQAYPLQLFSEVHYIYTLDAVFPQIGIPQFDKWIEEYVTDWKKSVKKNLGPFVTGEYFVQDRNRYVANLWVDIKQMNGELISGVITAFHIDKTGYTRESFIFDLKNGDRITGNDLLKDPSGLSGIRREAEVAKKAQVTAMMEDQRFREWVRDAEFIHMFLSREGIGWATDFHPVYGDMQIMLPNEEVRTEIRNRTVKRSNF